MKKILTAASLLLFSATAFSRTVVFTETNTVTLRGPVTDDSAAMVAFEVSVLDTLYPFDGPIYLLLDTPGGGIDAGLMLVRQLNATNRQVVTVSMFAASMGFHTVQGVNGPRYILDTGTLMSHRPRGGFGGEFVATDGGDSQLESRLKYYKKRIANMDNIAVKRANGKYTFKEYQDLIRSEYWCDGQDCVDDGFADEVVKAQCDISLSGVKNTVIDINFFGMPVRIELVEARCPLIPTPLDVKVTIDGETLTARLKKKITKNNIQMAIELDKRIQQEIDFHFPSVSRVVVK